METMTENFILIGMPASGKSAAGALFARKIGYTFLDGDDLIRALTQEPLMRTIEKRGAEGFVKAEEEALCGVRTSHAVIATGGSAIYSERAMKHLRSLGKIVYLKIAEEEVERRIPDFTARGVVMRGKISTLKELYEERAPLYEHYADCTVCCDGKSLEEIAEELKRL